MTHKRRLRQSQGNKKKSNEIATYFTVRCSGRPLQPFSCTRDVWNTLLISSDASIFSRGDLLRLSLANYNAILETASKTAAVNGLFLIIRDIDFQSRPPKTLCQKHNFPSKITGQLVTMHNQ